MIFETSIGDYVVRLDDELTNERPTPEVAADYLARCAQVALGMYLRAAKTVDVDEA